MTDKEFKRLNRAQLIEIIYQLQIKMDALSEENERLNAELADKRLRIGRAGNIAAAALEMNDCLRNVQQAADQYLEEIKALHAETALQCEKILADARKEAAELLADAKKRQGDYALAVDAILQEYGQEHQDHG
jgi:cell division septum initiation protein DivIVA